MGTAQQNGENSSLEQIERNLQENPGEYNYYQELVEHFEKKGEADGLRNAYERLLAEYPLMFGYWKKYAEFEDSLSRTEEAKQIFERGVNAVSTAVDLWAQYCAYVMSKSSDLDEIRELFEKAVRIAGGDYLSHKLWDKYIEFEVSQEEYGTVSMLYRRILSLPLKNLDTYWEQYKAHSADRPLTELVASSEEDTKLNEAANSHPDLATGRDLDSIKRDIINSWREELYKNSSQELQKIAPFEQAIKRYYFHVQPLAKTQLDNWKEYLAFEIREGQHDRIVRLFERCLETCALYFDFWQRYVHYLESKGEVEMARSVLRRAVTVFLKRSPEPYIALAEFEEQHGNNDAAQETFVSLLGDVGKGHIESFLRFVGFTRRQRGASDAFALFDQYKTDIDAESVPFFEVQRTHFAKLVLKYSEDQIREMFDGIVKEHAGSRIAWMAAVEFELNLNNTDNTVSLFERAMSVDAELLNDANRLFIARRYHNTLMLFGSSVAALRSLEAKITEFEDKTAKTLAASKKRRAEEAGIGDEGPEAKAHKTDASAVSAGGNVDTTTAAATTPQQGAASWYGAAYPQYYQQWYGAAATPAAATAGTVSPAGDVNGMTPEQQQQAYAQYYASAGAGAAAGQHQTPPPPPPSSQQMTQ